MTHGSVVAICIAPEAGAPMQSIQEVIALPGQGLRGDRYAGGKGSFNKKTGIGKRQVSLMNVRFFMGNNFGYYHSRRNIFVRDVELMWLINREFQIGDAVLLGIKYCDPCMRPSNLANTDQSFKDLFEDAGGLIADVVRGGLIRVEDFVIPPPKGY